jgi:hypothetical protein
MSFPRPRSAKAELMGDADLPGINTALSATTIANNVRLLSEPSTGNPAGTSETRGPSDAMLEREKFIKNLRAKHDDPEGMARMAQQLRKMNLHRMNTRETNVGNPGGKEVVQNQCSGKCEICKYANERKAKAKAKAEMSEDS